jgi:diamine N-acetyltransferase
MPRVRELQMQDAEKMYEWLCDPEVTRLLVLGRYPTSKEVVQDFIQNSWRDKKNIHFAIATDDNQYAGTVSLKNLDYIDRTAEYAIAIHRDYWGQGFAEFGTSAIITYAFERLNLQKIYLSVVSSNTRAKKFYEKYGFTKEGTFRRHVYLSGELVDLDWYCILR